jgi:transcription factor SPN1
MEFVHCILLSIDVIWMEVFLMITLGTFAFFREFVSDFELMLARKKEEMNKRRKKKKDSEIINDNDDLIAELIKQMKEAAEEDRALNEQKKPAIRKLRLLNRVMTQLRK